MKITKFFYLLSGVLILSNSGLLPTNKSFANTPTAFQIAQKAQTKRPATKRATISIEGEKTPVTLRLYQEPAIEFSTYIPEKDFIAESGSADEGTGARFYTNFGGTKNENAYIHFFFPARRTNLAVMKRMVTGKRGLLDNNKWQTISRTTNVPYRWVKEKITFRARRNNQNMVGNVLIGEYKGKAFYVITHYPTEYADGFGPRADLILRNAEFGW